MSQSAIEASSLEEITAKPLGEASVQEMQLELIRRRRYNALNGEKLAAALLEHRDLWEAAMMDRVAVSNPGRLPALGLRKLRDLPADDWNVDTLYLLTSSKEAAEKLAWVFNMQDWGCMVDIHTDPEEVDNALGGAQPGQVVVSLWWD